MASSFSRRRRLRSTYSTFVAAIALLAIGGADRADASQLIANLRAGQPQTAVTYGTSLTFTNWPTELRNWLHGQFPGLITVVNGSIPASASESDNDVFDGLVRLEERVLSHEPDTVFLEFSINDAFVPYHISLARSRENLNRMIDRILADDSGREVILMTMNPAWDVPGGLQPAADRPELAAYFQIYRDVAAERGLLLIDHYVNWAALRDADFERFKQYIPDGIHPSAIGQAQVILPEIKRALLAPEPSALALCGMAAFAFRRRYPGR